ncbi:MAG: hypothetical protein RL088_2873 [Verrucomicrobiota bacterium]|jgi:hypothetical protein
MTNNAEFDLFIERAHELLQAGYAALTAKDWEMNKEPKISGELTAEIRKLVDDAKRRKPWMRYWTPINDEPEDEQDKPKEKRRLGNNRVRPDIKLKFAGGRETLYFRFEAKRLKDTGDYRDLLSEDGLDRFLRSAYARKDLAGGLIGYVQTETCQIHSARVANALSNDPTNRYKTAKNGKWQKVNWKNGPEHSFRTSHTRGNKGEDILIFFTFLQFR